VPASLTPPRGRYNTYVPQATTLAQPTSAGGPVDQVEAAFQVVGRAITQVRLHERLLQAAGVRLDRAGAALLYKLHAQGEPQRVTELAALLGVDAPTVTRKIQQLEREQLVSRHPDACDRRATRIGLTPAGRRTIGRILKARRAWFDRLIEDWDQADLATFATQLGRFASALEHDMEDARGG
jgi:DNA-binding MarR family transcriptional regulator